MQSKTERFEMRLDPGSLDKVDDWRARQADLPSRAEAVRRLMEAGLATDERKSLSLSDGEKLITWMLCGIYKHLKIEGGVDPSFIEEALAGGHLWGIEWEYTGIFHGHDDRAETLSEVVDMLDMWWFIEQSHARLSKEEQERVAQAAKPFDTEFRGFDGNHEGEHRGIARFLINKMDRFADFKGRALNAHMRTVESYRRMLRVFEPMRRSLGGGSLLNADQIIEVVKAPAR